MLIKTKAIVLSALKYQEKSLIVKCFTESDGLKSYFVHNAFSSSKTASRKIAYFQPLTILEIEASHKNKGTLETFKEIRLSSPFATVAADISKSTIALFLSELLHHSIREEEKNPDLFAFLETALLWLDHHDEVANFHLVTLLQMTKFLGFYPANRQDGENYFDMVEGFFTELPGMNALDASETELVSRLLPLRFENGQGIFSASERRRLLKILIDYYALHLEGFRRPKSLEVLQQIFV
ncbi:DNA repair protein RecO [Flavobacterium silvaticum]|uniref:DNA repair protein RecO n=1 Tax=Flavobacterium silvaticum TaxID=1852020 RepID=A0A972FSB7_9FLAO|nr:DNA repair protein RecO [Flavobacterium silvaticum]NMH26630.1 DNA repair protein RecO [Flavobacterium silvaticum]